MMSQESKGVLLSSPSLSSAESSTEPRRTPSYIASGDSDSIGEESAEEAETKRMTGNEESGSSIRRSSQPTKEDLCATRQDEDSYADLHNRYLDAKMEVTRIKSKYRAEILRLREEANRRVAEVREEAEETVSRFREEFEAEAEEERRRVEIFTEQAIQNVENKRLDELAVLRHRLTEEKDCAVLEATREAYARQALGTPRANPDIAISSTTGDRKQKSSVDARPWKEIVKQIFRHMLEASIVETEESDPRSTSRNERFVSNEDFYAKTFRHHCRKGFEHLILSDLVATIRRFDLGLSSTQIEFVLSQGLSGASNSRSLSFDDFVNLLAPGDDAPLRSSSSSSPSSTPEQLHKTLFSIAIGKTLPSDASLAVLSGNAGGERATNSMSEKTLDTDRKLASTSAHNSSRARSSSDPYGVEEWESERASLRSAIVDLEKDRSHLKRELKRVAATLDDSFGDDGAAGESRGVRHSDASSNSADVRGRKPSGVDPYAWAERETAKRDLEEELKNVLEECGQLRSSLTSATALSQEATTVSERVSSPGRRGRVLLNDDSLSLSRDAPATVMPDSPPPLASLSGSPRLSASPHIKMAPGSARPRAYRHRHTEPRRSRRRSSGHKERKTPRHGINVSPSSIRSPYRGRRNATPSSVRSRHSSNLRKSTRSSRAKRRTPRETPLNASPPTTRGASERTGNVAVGSLPRLPFEVKTRRRADHKDWEKVSSRERGSFFGTYPQMPTDLDQALTDSEVEKMIADTKRRSLRTPASSRSARCFRRSLDDDDEEEEEKEKDNDRSRPTSSRSHESVGRSVDSFIDPTISSSSEPKRSAVKERIATTMRRASPSVDIRSSRAWQEESNPTSPRETIHISRRGSVDVELIGRGRAKVSPSRRLAASQDATRPERASWARRLLRSTGKIRQ